jgi:hypothetical protein
MITASTRKLFMTTREAQHKNTNAAKLKKTAAALTDEQHDAVVDGSVDPVAMLAMQSHECRHVTELHLGSKRLGAVHPNIQLFVNLEVLWLNDNKLPDVAGLLPVGTPALTDGARGCMRLKRLYLSNNSIHHLVGNIQRLKYLEVLLLANNRLTNMEQVSQMLAHLRFLKQLDLFGNPLAEEQNYRLFIIHSHPQIELFDRQTVTAVERREAAKLFGPAGVVAAAAAAAGETADAASASRRGLLGQTAQGFGSHVPAEQQMRPADAISVSAQFVEAKVRQIKLRDGAARQLADAKEERDYSTRAEKRRLFHTLWAPPAPAGEAPGESARESRVMNASSTSSIPTIARSTAAAAPAERVALSHLFDGDNADVAHLIELARERESSSSDTRRAEIDALVARLRHRLFPARYGDGFGAALQAHTAANAEEAAHDYEERLLGSTFTLAEMEACAKAYESGHLAAQDAGGLLSVVQGAGKLDANRFKAFFAVALDGEGSMDLRGAQAVLAGWIPFLEARHDQLFEEARTLLAKGNQVGGGAAHRRAAFLFDHMERVAGHQARPSRALGAAPVEAAAIGGAYAQMRQKHGAQRDTSGDSTSEDDDS